MKLFFKYLLIYFLLTISEPILFFTFSNLNNRDVSKNMLVAWIGLKTISLLWIITYLFIILLFNLFFSLLKKIDFPISNILNLPIAGALANLTFYFLPFYENYTLNRMPAIHLPMYIINGLFMGALFYFLKLEPKEELH